MYSEANILRHNGLEIVFAENNIHLTPAKDLQEFVLINELEMRVEEGDIYDVVVIGNEQFKFVATVGQPQPLLEELIKNGHL